MSDDKPVIPPVSFEPEVDTAKPQSSMKDMFLKEIFEKMKETHPDIEDSAELLDMSVTALNKMIARSAAIAVADFKFGGDEYPVVIFTAERTGDPALNEPDRYFVAYVPNSNVETQWGFTIEQAIGKLILIIGPEIGIDFRVGE